jgi:hypothetical protein
MDQPGVRTALIGLFAVLILFVPVPFVTQVVGIPLLVYACYRYWGQEG